MQNAQQQQLTLASYIHKIIISTKVTMIIPTIGTQQSTYQSLRLEGQATMLEFLHRVEFQPRGLVAINRTCRNSEPHPPSSVLRHLQVSGWKQSC